MKSDVYILVVDNSRPIREFVVQAIESREGFVTLEASDGDKGLELALANSPDLILYNLAMPDLNGFQILDALHAQRVDIPVILTASYGDESIATELFRKGVKGYLVEPFTVEEMYAAIERALTEARLRREKETLAQDLATANQQLRRSAQELDTLCRVGKSVISTLSRDQLLEQILDAIFHVIDAEEAALMLVDEKSGQLQTELHRQRMSGEIQQWARRNAEELSPTAAHKQDATGAMLSAPLKVFGKVIGALSIGNRVSTRPFSGHDRQLLLGLTNYAAIVIENELLHENARQADQAKSEIVSFVAHELRTPVTSIHNCADLLAKSTAGPLTPQQEEFICTILSNAEQMQALISNLRDISRIETGQLRLETKPVQLTEPLEVESQPGREETLAFTTPVVSETWSGREKNVAFATPAALKTWHGKKKRLVFTTPAALKTWHGKKKRLAFVTPAVLKTWPKRKNFSRSPRRPPWRGDGQ